MPGKEKKCFQNVEDFTIDIVIIGGGSGLAAAVAAAEKGAKVIVLEKRKKAGGNTAIAGGFMAAESPVQKRMRIEASREEIFKASMNYAHWNINPKIIRAIIDKSGDTVQWFENMGLNFMDVPHTFPNQHPRIYHIPENNGAGVIKILLKRCEELGVHIHYQTTVKKILIGQSGEVTGVLADRKHDKIKINAKAAVIVTGGFSGNKRLLKKHCRLYSDNIFLNGVPNMGDGLTMATQAGAAMEGPGTLIAMGPFFEGSKYVHSTAVEFFSIWLNSNGERFINEDSTFPSETANALNRQPDKICYAIYDDDTKRFFIEEGLQRGIVRPYTAMTKMTELDAYLKKDMAKGKAKISSSLKEIAEWIGTDTQILENNIHQYNSYCDQGYDEQFFKKEVILNRFVNRRFMRSDVDRPSTAPLVV